MSDTITAPDGVREAAGQEEAELSGRTARLAEAEKEAAEKLQASIEYVNAIHDTVIIVTKLAEHSEAADYWETVASFFNVEDDSLPAVEVLGHLIDAVTSGQTPIQGQVEALAHGIAAATGFGYWFALPAAKLIAGITPTDDDYRPMYWKPGTIQANLFRRTWTLFVDRANELAVEQDWCGEYERVIESIESRLATPNLTTPSRMVRSEVAITWTVTYSTSVTVEHHPNEYASDAADERGLTRVEEHFDLPVGYDNIDVEVEVW